MIRQCKQSENASAWGSYWRQMRLKALECLSQEKSRKSCEGEYLEELPRQNGILTDKGMGIMKKF